MPSAALKKFAKTAKVSNKRAEHLWNKAKGIVKAEYGYSEGDDNFWALTTGITKKMMGLGEELTEAEELAYSSIEGTDAPLHQMDMLLTQLLNASKVARMWHWKVKSFSMHQALGELYTQLDAITDELAEMYMGAYGTDGHIEMSQPNTFSEEDPLEFIKLLHVYLENVHGLIPQDGFLVNKFEELQAAVARIKYKMENLTEAKETPYHLIPTLPGAPKKFDSRPVDFTAAIERAHGQIKPKVGADKNKYYIKNGKTVAKYDTTLDVGYVYEGNK